MKSFCVLCGSNKFDQLNKRDAKSQSPLQILSCLDCTMIQQKDIPSDEELKIYYSHNYRKDYKSTYEPKPKYVQRAGMAALDRIRFIESHIQTSQQSLLDIGAGGGEFVYMANLSGFKATGIEPNLGYSKFSIDNYGVNVETKMLSDLQDSSVDILTMFHVFEHMAKPHEVIKKLYSSLRTNGHLFIEVPNILQADASPHNIFFKAHLFYYSKYTLISIASKYFDVIKIDDSGNLKILFRKKTNPLNNISLPTINEISDANLRFNKKGWFNYILFGGGLIKPLKRVERIVSELMIRKFQPKEILDILYSKKGEYSKIFSKQQLKRIGGWSSAGGIGFLCFEAFC